MSDRVPMNGVREYAARRPVCLVEGGRVYVQAETSIPSISMNPYTSIDLADLLAWLAANRPALLAPYADAAAARQERAACAAMVREIGEGHMAYSRTREDDEARTAHQFVGQQLAGPNGIADAIEARGKS